VRDAEDPCPRQPEDVDNFEDEDGCPDPDNDQDGVADAKDECPLEAEVINGVKDEDGCPDKGKSAVTMEHDRVAITERVQFKTASAVVSPASFKLLNQVASILKAYPNTRIYVDGHTDDVGSPAKDQILSERRAQSVARFLAGKGIDPVRLEARGFGRTRPLKKNSSAAQRLENRRVEFVVKGDQP